jgi:WD40 repeat protein
MNSPIVNCTALSPCGRLRLLVGDFPNTLLTDARCAAATLLHSLPTPPLSFAAAWAPDNAWYVATASDFGDFRLWDARMWRVFASFRATMAPVRALRFAPLGPGGSLALFAAESFDRVHVVDVLAARCVQTMQFLGEVGGLAVGSDGSEVMVANGDCTFGGITVFERNVDMNSWNSPRIVNEWDGSGYGRRNRGLNWRGVDGLMDLDLL